MHRGQKKKQSLKQKEKDDYEDDVNVKNNKKNTRPKLIKKKNLILKQTTWERKRRARETAAELMWHIGLHQNAKGKQRLTFAKNSSSSLPLLISKIAPLQNLFNKQRKAVGAKSTQPVKPACSDLKPYYLLSTLAALDIPPTSSTSSSPIPGGISA